MRNGDNDVLKKMLSLIRLVAFPAVVVLLISIVMLIVMSFIKLVGIFRLFVMEENILNLPVSEVSANLLSIIDVYLLIIVAYIMAMAFYKFFINEIGTGSWLNLNTLNDLKAHIASVIVLFLIIFTVKKIVEWKSHIEIVYFGSIIALMCVVLIWYSIYLSKCKRDSSHNKLQKGECPEQNYL